MIPSVDVDLNGCAQAYWRGLPAPVVVTLARRPDRWEAAVRHLHHHGISRIIKAEAVDGQLLAPAQLVHLVDDPDAVNRPLDQYLQLTKSAIGCFLSHLAIWKQFMQSGEDWVLILEDDAVLADDVPADLVEQMLNTMPPDADMLLLGCTIMDGLAEATADPRFTRIYYYNGTYAYLLTRKGCHALLPRLLPLKTHIDNQISLALVANRDDLHVYCAEPRIFNHDFGVRSDVYIPVTDTLRADNELAAIFSRARATLEAGGAQLFPKFEPQPSHSSPGMA